jgi:hypothetical protein
MGRRADIHFAIDEHVQAHRRDGLDIDIGAAARRIATVIGPRGLLITQIEELVAKAAENAGVAVHLPKRSTPQTHEVTRFRPGSF